MTGLAPCSATSERVDGSFAPDGAVVIQRRSAVTMRTELLSSTMKNNSSATLDAPPVLSPSRAGLGWGLLGVSAFSFTVPFTRVAVESGGMSPLFIGSARAVVAALLAAVALAVTKQRLPVGVQWARVAIVAGGVIVGFPVLTSFALTTAPASHGAVVIAVLPAATAVTAVLRGHERPPKAFWLMAAVGAIAALVFAALQGGGFSGLNWADLLLFGAVAAAAIGYAEGGLLARELGAWQTVSWAIVLASPVTIALTAVSLAQGPRVAPGRMGRVGLPGRGEHVPRLLRLVPRARHRSDRAGQPGAARPAGAEHLLGRAVPARAADLADRPRWCRGGRLRHRRRRARLGRDAR